MRQNAGLLSVVVPVALAVVGCAALRGPGDDGWDSALLRDLDKQGDLLRAERADGPLPLDPNDAKWRTAREYTISLVSQFAVAPKSPDLIRSKIRVRALYNDEDLALLLVSKDRTKNEQVSSVGLFGDAIAVGFPAEYGADVPLPYIGMGNKGRPVNIWQWKAAWQADVDRGYQGSAAANPNRVPNSGPIQYRAGLEAGSSFAQESRTTAVENLMAEGFGTLTSTPSAGLEGRGIFNDGGWHVVIKRPLRPHGEGSQIRTEAGLLPITFAVWDGASAERNGMKGLTRWRFLAFSGEEMSAEIGSGILTAFADADAKKGKEWIAKMKCGNCHKLPGAPAGEGVGPDLTFAGAIHRPQYLLESIKEPSAVVVPAPGYGDPSDGTSTMPAYDDDLLSDSDYRNMAQYLWTLR